MNRKYHVTLTTEERETIKQNIAKRNSKSVVVRRGFILLSLDENQGRLSDEEIRTRYKVSQSTIERTRQRFVEDGFEIALKGSQRTVFKEKLFDGRVEAHLIALRCSDPPPGHQQWTLRLLAEQMMVLEHVGQMSHESVRQLLKKTS